jgi:hypothetical protein
MSERGPIYKRLEVLKTASHEFFFGFRTPLKAMQLREIEKPNPSQKRYLEDQTMRIVYACVDVLTHLNPQRRVTIKIENNHDLNYESLGRTGEEAA